MNISLSVTVEVDMFKAYSLVNTGPHSEAYFDKGGLRLPELSL